MPITTVNFTIVDKISCVARSTALLVAVLTQTYQQIIKFDGLVACCYVALLQKTEDSWKVLLDIDHGAQGAAPDLIQKLQEQVQE